VYTRTPAVDTAGETTVFGAEGSDGRLIQGALEPGMANCVALQGTQATAPPLDDHEPSAALREIVTVGPAKPRAHV
jgi:hypothetical protein